MTQRESAAMDTSDDDADKIETLRSCTLSADGRVDAAAAAPHPARRTARNAFFWLVGGGDTAPRGIVLPFPVRGEALLVTLAARLRERFAGDAFEREPLALTISRCPQSRLSIDRDAYVEFDADRAVYHTAIETTVDTTIMLDTTDFDTAVNFIAHYLSGRLASSKPQEVLP